MCYIPFVLHLLIATRNPGKLREYMQLLSSLPLVLHTPNEIGLTIVAEEHGQTYAENALEKAMVHQRASGLWTLADDSGLEVEALGGRPGIHSARYGGPDADDALRHQLLLQELSDVPWSARGARFRCAIALVTATGETHHAEGSCKGVIAYEPRGRHGFGYDPLFFIPEYGMTMSQLPPETKNRISHRARALHKMALILRPCLGEHLARGEG